MSAGGDTGAGCRVGVGSGSYTETDAAGGRLEETRRTVETAEGRDLGRVDELVAVAALGADPQLVGVESRVVVAGAAAVAVV